MIPIPANFDYRSQDLDPLERYIRDQLNINIDEWIKFRWCINIGLNSENLLFKHGVKDDFVCNLYKMLGPNHYECIVSLGYAFQCYEDMIEHQNDLFLTMKLFKEFYFHIGCFLDNFSRLALVLSKKLSPSSNDKKLLLKIDWGTLSRDTISKKWLRKYQKLIKLNEIINIRNSLTHYWRFPLKHEDGVLKIPQKIRTNKDAVWHYDNPKFKSEYRKYISIKEMMEDDIKFFINFQNKLFSLLIKKIRTFEKNYNVKIV